MIETVNFLHQVWGCGGYDALHKQKMQKDWESKEVEKAKNRKVCIAS
jgi:hypothetical protein